MNGPTATIGTNEYQKHLYEQASEHQQPEQQASCSQGQAWPCGPSCCRWQLRVQRAEASQRSEPLGCSCWPAASGPLPCPLGSRRTPAPSLRRRWWAAEIYLSFLAPWEYLQRNTKKYKKEPVDHDFSFAYRLPNISSLPNRPFFRGWKTSSLLTHHTWMAKLQINCFSSLINNELMFH